MSLADLNINKTLGRKWCQEQLFPRLGGKFIGQERVYRQTDFSIFSYLGNKGGGRAAPGVRLWGAWIIFGTWFLELPDILYVTKSMLEM